MPTSLPLINNNIFIGFGAKPSIHTENQNKKKASKQTQPPHKIHSVNLLHGSEIADSSFWEHRYSGPKVREPAWDRPRSSAGVCALSQQ